MNNDDPDAANEALKLFTEQDADSEMHYDLWEQVHPGMKTALMRIAKKGEQLALASGVQPGKHMFLWADAVASTLYAYYKMPNKTPTG